MTENLLQKLEEKAMMLLSELETLRHTTQQLKKENATLRMEREGSLKKLQDLISVFDTISLTDDTAITNQLPLANREYVAA